ncbi:MAG: sulfatase-like hydrolase/transferase, partial [Deltaproteobacteria bacterium]|nr:sulfatase-like hydrolase/transferase [Deltaproteobacteria bacterium]
MSNECSSKTSAPLTIIFTRLCAEANRTLREIAVIDTELGKLFAALDAAGVRERTLIAIVGDHGQGMGDHGWWG